MKEHKNFDVIIVGGSYSGLSAAMSLARASRPVLIIDGGEPCNSKAAHSHNLLTHDGKTPKEISIAGKEQVAMYDSVQFYDGLAISGAKTIHGFEIKTAAGDTFIGRKLIFATGLKDMMPGVEGYAACWGISILHCPYCHGYEVKGKRTGVIVNGDIGFEFTKMIAHWTKDLVLFTNGPSTLTEEQTRQLTNHTIRIIETEIESIEHTDGQVANVILKDKTSVAMEVIYAKPPFVQHCDIPVQMDCELTEQGLLKTDPFQKTNVAGIYACGDNSSFGRALSVAISSGTMAGAFLNKELIDEAF